MGKLVHINPWQCVPVRRNKLQMKITVFWNVTPGWLTISYQLFGRDSCLIIQVSQRIINTEAARFSESPEKTVNQQGDIFQKSLRRLWKPHTTQETVSEQWNFLLRNNFVAVRVSASLSVRHLSNSEHGIVTAAEGRQLSVITCNKRYYSRNFNSRIGTVIHYSV
jgi:hypothetical protein